jgi:hypothetical protein
LLAPRCKCHIRADHGDRLTYDRLKPHDCSARGAIASMEGPEASDRQGAWESKCMKTKFATCCSCRSVPHVLACGNCRQRLVLAIVADVMEIAAGLEHALPESTFTGRVQARTAAADSIRIVIAEWLDGKREFKGDKKAKRLKAKK